MNRTLNGRPFRVESACGEHLESTELYVEELERDRDRFRDECMAWRILAGAVLILGMIGWALWGTR